MFAGTIAVIAVFDLVLQTSMISARSDDAWHELGPITLSGLLRQVNNEENAILCDVSVIASLTEIQMRWM